MKKNLTLNPWVVWVVCYTHLYGKKPEYSRFRCDDRLIDTSKWLSLIRDDMSLYIRQPARERQIIAERRFINFDADVLVLIVMRL